MMVNDARKWLIGLGLVLGAMTPRLVSSPFAKPLHAPLFKSSASPMSASSASLALSPDTLEVFCLYVQFLEETANEDEATTTGLGTFGSAGKGKGDPDKKQEYTLDPNGNLRSYRSYLEKHFEFARNYFEKVSNGRVTVVPRIFPKPDGDGKVRPYNVSLRMKAYNPSELDKEGKQKISDFSAERGQRLMSFVYETVKAADSSEDSARNPFLVVTSSFMPVTPGFWMGVSWVPLAPILPMTSPIFSSPRMTSGLWIVPLFQGKKAELPIQPNARLREELNSAPARPIRFQKS
jgi:hypothetical protein